MQYTVAVHDVLDNVSTMNDGHVYSYYIAMVARIGWAYMDILRAL